VGGVEGVKGPEGLEPQGAKKKKGVESDAFKEIMKVGKTPEVDEEQKRKRKRREEAAEDLKAKQTKPPQQGPAAEPGKVPSPFEPGAGKKVGAEPPAGPAPAPGEEPPAAPPPPPPFFPPEEPGVAPPMPPPEEGAQAPERKKKKEKKEPAAAPPKKKPKKEEVAPKKKKPPIAAPKMEKGEKVVPTEVPIKKPEEDLEAFFKALAKPEEKPPEKKKIEEPTEAVAPPLPEGAWEATKAPAEEKKAEKKEAPAVPPQLLAPSPEIPTGPAAPAPLAAAPLIAPFANLSPQILQLFERMVGVMTVMTTSGISETTINLDAPQFAGSVFFGAQIVIREFSTAPKTYNIELIGNSQAVNLFQGGAEDLVAAFQAGKYNFKVNRIDTSLLPALRAEKKRRVKRVKKKGEL